MFAAATVAVLLLTASAYAMPGDLDPAFGAGGKVLTPLDYGGGEAAARQADDKLVVGSCTQDLSLLLFRYLPDGRLDPAFAQQGRVLTRLSQEACVADVLVQPDGKIVALAQLSPGGFALVRYSSDGSLDASFGDGGKFEKPQNYPTLPRFTNPKAVALQADGKIVIAGSAIVRHNSDTTYPYSSGPALARINSNGTLDTSFGRSPGGGLQTELYTREASAAGSSWASDVVIDTTGKILIGGAAIDQWLDASDSSLRYRVILGRYASSGVPDTGFGTSGRVIRTFGGADENSRASAVALEPNGRIVLGGDYQTGMFAARFTTNGVLDTQFGTGGHTAIKPPPTLSGGAVSVAIQQADGRIVLGGNLNDNSCCSGTTRFGLARLNRDGSLDASFGNGGAVIGPPSGNPSSDNWSRADARAMICQPDGNFVLAGHASSAPSGAGSASGIGLARYLGETGTACYQPSGAETPTPLANGSYVALGDSVAAGEGIGYGWQWVSGNDGSIGSYRWFRSGDEQWDTSFVPEFCHQTSAAAPRLVKASLKVSLQHFACTGSTAYNGVLKERTDKGDTKAPAQLGSGTLGETAPPNPQYDAARPDLVSLSLGANDIDFRGFVEKCYSYWKLPCGTDADEASFEDKLKTQAATLRLVLEEIQRRGVSAGKVPLVALTEYYDPFPAAYPEGNDRCVDVDPPLPIVGLSAKEMSFLRAGLLQLQRSIEQIGRQFPNVVLIRSPVPFRSHRWCSTDPWAYGPSIIASTTGQATDRENQAPFHPTPDGQRSIAATIANALGSQQRVPTGSNVTAPLPGGGWLTFDTVTAAGQVAFVPGDQVAGYPVAPNFRLKNGFDLASSVQFSGSATISIPAAPGDRLYHHVDGRWVEVPSSYAGGVLRATVTSFSPYALGQPASTIRAAFTSSGQTLAPASLAFDGSLSATSDRPIASYEWDFGDGGNASGLTTTHLYRISGDYTVTLTATTEDGAVDTATKVVSITNVPPVASATAPQSAVIGASVEFDGSRSSDGNGSIDEYFWDFGDDSAPVSGRTARHVYTSSGRFTVRLTAFDNEGEVGETTVPIDVTVPMGTPSAGGLTSAPPAILPTIPTSPARIPTVTVPKLWLSVSIQPSVVTRRTLPRLSLLYRLSLPTRLRIDPYRALGKKFPASKCRARRLLLRRRCYAPVSGSGMTIAGNAGAGTVSLRRFWRGSSRLGIGRYAVTVQALDDRDRAVGTAYAYFAVRG